MSTPHCCSCVDHEECDRALDPSEHQLCRHHAIEEDVRLDVFQDGPFDDPVDEGDDGD